MGGMSSPTAAREGLPKGLCELSGRATNSAASEELYSPEEELLPRRRDVLASAPRSCARVPREQSWSGVLQVES